MCYQNELKNYQTNRKNDIKEMGETFGNTLSPQKRTYKGNFAGSFLFYSGDEATDELHSIAIYEFE